MYWFIDLLPRFVSRMIYVTIGRCFVFELESECGIVLPRLHARGFNPYVLDAGDFGGHGLNAVYHGLLLLGCGIRRPLDRHYVHDGRRLMERVLPCQHTCAEDS